MTKKKDNVIYMDEWREARDAELLLAELLALSDANITFIDFESPIIDFEPDPAWDDIMVESDDKPSDE